MSGEEATTTTELEIQNTVIEQEDQITYEPEDIPEIGDDEIDQVVKNKDIASVIFNIIFADESGKRDEVVHELLTNTLCHIVFNTVKNQDKLEIYSEDPIYNTIIKHLSKIIINILREQPDLWNAMSEPIKEHKEDITDVLEQKVHWLEICEVLRRQILYHRKLKLQIIKSAQEEGRKMGAEIPDPKSKHGKKQKKKRK